MVKKTDLLRDIVFSMLLLLVGFLTLYLLPQFFLFGQGGVENPDNLWKFTIYSGIGAFAIIIIVMLKIIRWIFRNNPEYDWVDSVGHDPEKSFLSKIPFIKIVVNNIVLLWLASLLFFLPISIGAALRPEQTFYPDTIVLELEQQTTETAELGLSAYPASPAETLFLAVVVTFILLILGWLKKQDIITLGVYQVLKYTAVPIIGTMLWVTYHFARYGNIQTALVSVALFGFISTFLIVLFHSIIPAMVYHDVNNIIKKAFTLFSSDQLLIVLGVFIAILTVIFAYLLIQNLFKSESEQNEVT